MVYSGLFGVAMVVSQAATAQVAGSYWVKAGVNHITPHVDSGNLSAPSMPNSQIDLGSGSSVILAGGRMLSDHWSVEAVLGAPYRHTVQGAGSLQGVGKLGSVQQLPPTVFVQYRFGAPEAVWRPYLGAGVSYAWFRDERSTSTLTALTNHGGAPTTFSVKNAWGVTGQIGMTYAINAKWYLDGVVNKTWMQTSTRLSTGQSLDLRIDPVSIAVSVGYRF